MTAAIIYALSILPFGLALGLAVHVVAPGIARGGGVLVGGEGAMIPRARTIKRPGDLILARDCTMIVTADGRHVRLRERVREGRGR